ncbi:hypothetical protein FCG41_11935 [Azotobacter chroococcum]|nr:hypothetical protein FCG41_11935 [Azotobacter chroococcum]
MSSLEIAERTGKDHGKVLRDIRRMLRELDIAEATFGSSYADPTGRSLPCFNLPRREVEILITGYSIKLRAKVIDRLHQLERVVQRRRDPLWQAVRGDGKLQQAQLEDAIKGRRALDGKEAPPYLYANEARMLGRVLTGKWQGLERDDMSATALAVLNQVTSYNAILFAFGRPMEERERLLGEKVVQLREQYEASMGKALVFKSS